MLTISQEKRLKLEIHQMKAEHSTEWNQLKEQIAELKKVLEHKVWAKLRQVWTSLSIRSDAKVEFIYEINNLSIVI